MDCSRTCRNENPPKARGCELGARATERDRARRQWWGLVRDVKQGTRGNTLAAASAWSQSAVGSRAVRVACSLPVSVRPRETRTPRARALPLGVLSARPVWLVCPPPVNSSTDVRNSPTVLLVAVRAVQRDSREGRWTTGAPVSQHLIFKYYNRLVKTPRVPPPRNAIPSSSHRGCLKPSSVYNVSAEMLWKACRWRVLRSRCKQ